MPNKIHERIDSLTGREKIIVFATLLVIMWGMWDSFIHRPLSEKQKQLSNQLTSVGSQADQLEKSVTELERASQSDPNAENLSKLDALKAQYSRMQEQFLFGNKKFVPPEQMAKVLGDILNQNSRLTLIKLETLPTGTLLDTKDKQQPIYKHGLAITFSGTYADTVNYLEDLEALPWAIVWDVLDYRVKAYPKAEITLRVLTLSFNKEWLGV